MKCWYATFSVAIILLCLVAPGCKKNPLGVVPVKGTVTIDGEIVPFATITFWPAIDDGLYATAKSDDKGAFELVTQGSPINGAKPGDYTVTVVKLDGNYGDVAPRGSGEPEGPYVPTSTEAPTVQHLLPVKYNSKISSDIKITIPKGGDKAVKLNLTNN
ncbi:MAG: carboxypeptidase-like regulatory domain-containing protein [Thermoguttaceae bacterium]